MRRVLKATLYACIIILIGMSLGLGASIIYADYLYSPSSPLTSMRISLPNSYTASAYFDKTQAQESVRNMFESARSWADDTKATLLYAGGDGFVVNYGVYCATDLLERELGIDGLGDGDEPGVYVRNDQSLFDAYVHDTVILPGLLGLPVLGTFDATSSIPAMNRADFYYPLEEASYWRGILYTDAVDINDLVSIIENFGFEATILDQPLSVSLTKLPFELLEGNSMSRALVVAMVALVLCLGYLYLRIWHEQAESLWKRHLYGLSRQRIAAKGLLMTLALAFVQTVMFSLVLIVERSYMSVNDLILVFTAVLFGLHLLNLLAYLGGYFWLIHNFTQREGFR